jgi:hypothetical protein
MKSKNYHPAIKLEGGGERSRKRKQRQQPRKSETGWSISAWCKHRGIGRTTFYELVKEGKSPVVHRPRGRPRTWAEITIEADAAWGAANPTTPAMEPQEKTPCVAESAGLNQWELNPRALGCSKAPALPD